MSVVALPYTLTNGTTADAAQVQANDVALRDGHNTLEAAYLAAINSQSLSYKTVNERRGDTNAAAVTASGVYALTSSGVILSSAAAAYTSVFYFDPADFAISGRTTNLRLRCSCGVNGVQTGQTTTLGLYPVTATVGSAITVGTVVAGSTVAFANPAFNSFVQGVSGDFTAPAAGYYCLAFATGGAWAASSGQALAALLQVRQV